MLQNIREHIQGWVAGIIIALIAVAFIIWGLQYYVDQSGRGGATVAKVNGKRISEKTLQHSFQRIERIQLSKSGGVPLTTAQRNQLKQETLQSLITKTALLQAAKKAGFRVSLDQVKHLIMAVPEFQVNGQFSMQKFQEALYANVSSPAEFFKSVQDSLIVNQVAAGIEGSAFALPYQVKNAYLQLKQTRDFGYFLIPLDKFLANISVQEKDIKQYYQQHKGAFQEPEKVSVQYIMISPQTLMKQVNVTPQEVKRFYNNNIASFTTAKQWQISQITIPVAADATAKEVAVAKSKINQLVNALRKGTDFNKLMKQGVNGQEASTSWFNGEQLSASITQIIERLKVSEVSPPVRTQQGYTIVKLDAVKGGKTKPFAEVKTNIEKRLMHQKTEALLSQQSDQLANLTYTNPNSLEPAAKALDLKIQSSPLITRQGTKAGLFAKPNILAVVFNRNVLEQGNNSNPITLKDGSVVVLRVHRHIPSKTLSYAVVHEKIKKQLQQATATRKAGLQAYEIQTALSRGIGPNELAKKYNLNWVVEKNISRNDKKLTIEILNDAFNLSTPTDKKIAVKSILLRNNNTSKGYAVIQLLKIHLPKYGDDVSDHQKKILRTNLANFSGQTIYHGYVKSVLDQAKVKIYK